MRMHKDNATPTFVGGASLLGVNSRTAIGVEYFRLELDLSSMAYPPPQGHPPANYPPPPQYGQQPQPSAPMNYPPQAQAYPDPSAALASQMQGMSLRQFRAGDTALLSLFGQGNVIVLQSKASGQSLRIRNGEVEGTGGRGKLAQFTVHVRRPGVVALQNVNNPDGWLGVIDNKIIGSGRGGPYCEFLIGEHEGKMVSLESTMYPGQHVGILPDGCAKPPYQTGTGQHGRFIPSLISQGSPPVNPQPPPPSNPVPPPYTPVQQPPPPVQAPPPMQGQQFIQPYPVATGVATGVAAGVAAAGYTPGYPPQQYSQPPPPMQPQPPQGPQLPQGFNIMDAFRSGNVIQLIWKENGRCVAVQQGRITPFGPFGKKESNWIVIEPPGAQPGVIVLRNEAWGGVHPGVQKGGACFSGKGGKWCHLKVVVQPDNYCSFMSVEIPGKYINFLKNGSMGGAKVIVSSYDTSAQFFIRVVKQIGGNSQTIMTPFGRPSIINSLRDRSIIQLYLKASNTYLGISRSGGILTTQNGNDPLTFFVVIDRGMGIISLHTRNFDGYRVRMINSVMRAKGVSDLNADFRVKDESDGTMCLESVTCPNTFVSIGQQIKLNVNLLQIQTFGATENVSKTPLN